MGKGAGVEGETERAGKRMRREGIARGEKERWVALACSLHYNF